MARSLTQIVNNCGTDKGTVHGDSHGYTFVYELLLAPNRKLQFNLLEIGLQVAPEADHTASRSATDVPSVKMWREYCPKAHIYGVDISDWFTFFQADCGEPIS